VDVLGFSIRSSLLFAFVGLLAIYAWRDWFVSVCGLILLTAVIEHPDCPKNIMGIQGLNPWNVLMFNAVLAWLVQRRREGAHWDMPGPVVLMLLLYLAVVVFGFCRMMSDPQGLERFTLGYLVSENLINTVKWVVPGIMLFDGCRSRERLVIALLCVLGLYFLLAVQVIRWVPPRFALSGMALTARSRKIITNEIGYHAVNMARMLAGASWAMFAGAALFRRRRHRWLLLSAGLATAYAVALTAGRTGYFTWLAVGLVMCLLRWRRALLALPVVVVLIVAVAPGAMERMLWGFGQEDVAGEAYINQYEVTSGRTLVWPVVIEKILEAPLLGYGRLAMVRTGLADYMMQQYWEAFAHPHNAYLQWMLDNGVIGLLLIAPFYAAVLYWSGRLFVTGDRLCGAVGGVAFALVLALLVAGFGSQTFYPREGDFGMWCGIGLMLRVAVERKRLLARSAIARTGGLQVVRQVTVPGT